MCHASRDTLPKKTDTLVELVGGGSVINRPTLSSFHLNHNTGRLLHIAVILVLIISNNMAATLPGWLLVQFK